MLRIRGIHALIVATAAFLAACGNGAVNPTLRASGASLPSWQLTQQLHLASKKIQHVVIIVQENRSFNNLFYGYPGATTASYGYDSYGKKISLKPVSLVTPWDMEHNGHGFIRSCNGTGNIPGTDCRMNGFNLESCSPVNGPCPSRKYLAYSYAPPKETKPYFTMAHQYVLADQMYAADFDVSSFISHQYIIAGVNPNSSVDYPLNGVGWGCPAGKTAQIAILEAGRKWSNSNTEQPCWDPTTLGDELDTANLSWAFYATPLNANGSGGTACGKDVNANGSGSRIRNGIWSAYQAIKHICYGDDWDKDVAPFSPPTQFLTDIGNGELRAVSWITPTCQDSDHAGCDCREPGNCGTPQGPSWVASVVNAIGESKFWDSSAIFVFWDDSGGWYDPEAPGYSKYSDYDGLGSRLPLLIISPYARKGYVSHTHYTHGSILQFVEQIFGLKALAWSDSHANSADDAFDFSQSPRKFVPIKAPYDADHFKHERPDGAPPDTD